MKKKTIIEKINSIIEKNGSFTTADVMAMQSPLINSVGKSTFVLAETFHKHSCEGVVYVHDREEGSDDYDYDDLSEDVLYEILLLAEEWDAICYKTEKRSSSY